VIIVCIVPTVNNNRRVVKRWLVVCERRETCIREVIYCVFDDVMTARYASYGI